MLQSLVDGREPSQVILIEDNVDVSGRGLLKCFLNSLATRFQVVHVVLYEMSPSSFTAGLQPHVLSRLKIHDGASDPLSWHDVTDSPHDVITLQMDLCDQLARRAGVRDVGDVAVVIDSLDLLVLHRSASYTCRTLHRLGAPPAASPDCVSRVVALLHADLHDDVTRGLLRHGATSCVMLEPGGDGTSLTARVRHQKTSGKLLQSVEQFTLTDDLVVTDVTSPTGASPHTSSHPAPDPTAGITFNLSLSEGEREARTQLILPYTRAQHVDPCRPSAQVFYHPDDADDFDEEDPDDDLNI